jgi:TolB-like protein/Tfp pilus assembly protein PilF
MQSFLQELKRRNVVRVALVYIIAAWIMMQVVDVMFPALNLPQWTVTAVAALILIGFPFALIFAWAFEVTPEGLKREKDVDRSQSITNKTGKKLNQLVIGGLVLAIAVLVTERLVVGRGDVPSEATAIPATADAPPASGVPRLSIAVLPFVNMSGDADNEYFSDGLSEELLNVLAKISQLRVTGRTSSFKFKGTNEDLRVIGEQLNVANVLEGSVRKSGNKVRVTAQLVETQSGYHLWSETYDRELTDIFVIQDEIAVHVVDALKVTLLGEQLQDALPGHGTDNIEAYNLFLQGRYFRVHQNEDNIRKSIAMFEQAIALDPGYARAYAQLALSQHDYVGTYSFDQNFIDDYQVVRDNAARALELDPLLGDALLAQATVQIIGDRDIAAGEATLQRALELEPANVDILGWYGATLLVTQRASAAIDVYRQALELDPLSIPSMLFLGDSYRIAGRPVEAEKSYNRVLETDPDVVRVHGRLGFLHLMNGDPDKAQAEFELEPVAWAKIMGRILVLRRRHKTFEWEEAIERYIAEFGEQNAYQYAELYADAGNADLAFEWLDKAAEIYDPGLIWIEVSPLLRSLHDDPRWPIFLNKINRVASANRS